MENKFKDGLQQDKAARDKMQSKFNSSLIKYFGF